MNAFSYCALRGVLLLVGALGSASCGGQPPAAPAATEKVLGLAPQGCEAGTLTVSSTGRANFVVICDPSRTGVTNAGWCPTECFFSLSAASDSALERGAYELHDACRRISDVSLLCSVKLDDAARVMSRSFIGTKGAYVNTVEVRSSSTDGRTGKPFKFDRRSDGTFAALVNAEIANARGESIPSPASSLPTTPTAVAEPPRSERPLTGADPRAQGPSDSASLDRVEADLSRLEKKPEPWGDEEIELVGSISRRLQDVLDHTTGLDPRVERAGDRLKKIGASFQRAIVLQKQRKQETQAPHVTPEQAKRDAEAVRKLPGVCIECCHAKMPSATREHCQVACRTVTVHHFAASEAMMPDLEGTIFGSAPAATRWDTTHAFYNTLDRQLKCQ